MPLRIACVRKDHAHTTAKRRDNSGADEHEFITVDADHHYLLVGRD